jgi:Predicted membrane protein (DUF2339)
MAFGYLLLVLYLIAAIAAPPLVILLAIRLSKLRSDLNALKQETAQQNAKLLRDIAELKRQVAAAPSAGAPSERSVPGEVRQPIPVPSPFPQVVIPPSPVVPPFKEPTVATPRTEPREPIKPPAPAFPQVTETRPPLQPEQKPPAHVPVAPPPKPILPAPAPIAPVGPKQLVPAGAAPPYEPKPPAPTSPEVKPPASIPPLKIEIRPEVPQPPALRQTPPAAVPPTAAARISTPPPTQPFRAVAPKPTLQQRMRAVSAVEETLGTNWLTKLGIILTVIGVSLFGIYELGSLGAPGKVLISYFAAALLLGGGIFVERRERYELFGRVGIGGGWALLFWTTYALNNVHAMHVLDSLFIDCLLMLLVAVAMAAHTLRYRSQLVTGLAFLLGYTTVALSFSEVQPLSSAGPSQGTVYGLFAGVVLAIGLVGIVLKMGWFELEVFGILSSYLNHIYWLFRLLGPNGAHGRAFPEYRASLAMLFFYWLVFHISYVARSIKTGLEERVSTVSAILNMGLLLGCLKFQAVNPDLAYIALFAIGAAELFCGQLRITKRRREAFVVLTVAGAALILAAVPSHYSGNNVAILWLVGAEVFLAAGITVKEILFRRLGLLTGLLVGVHLAGFDFRKLLELRSKNENLALASGALFALCALVFYLNALGIGSRWKGFFAASPDRQFPTLHSYLGAFSAASAAWALLSQDWTALAFAGIMLVLAAFARGLTSGHLQIQYGLLGLLTLYRAALFNLHFESVSHKHIATRLLTLPILGVAFYLTAKLAALSDAQEQRVFRGLFAFAGTALFASLIWFEVPELWQPLAFIAFAVVLSEAGRAFRYHVLAAHSHLLALLSIFTALTADPSNVHVWRDIPIHAFAALPVVAACYWLAKRLGVENPRHLEIARTAYTWFAAGLMVWVLEEALRAPWMAVGWIVFALLLALSTRWIRYQQLAWQANAVAVAAFIRTFTYNLNLHDPLWRSVSLRLFTVGLVIVAAYLLAKIAADALLSFSSAVRNAHTWAAAFFVGLLIWYEAPETWKAVYFIAAGILLALIGRRWNLPHLGFQEHLFALAAVLRTVDFNYHLTSHYGHFSARLITVSIVAAGLYAISRKSTAPDAPHVLASAYSHTTTATALLALLMWYETYSNGSIGWLAALWAAFALVLAAVDRRFKLEDLRWQAHGLSALALVRSVGINLYMHDTWRGLSVRLLSLSIVTVLFYAMARLVRMPDKWRSRDFHHIYSWSASLLVSLLLWYELQPQPPSIAVALAIFGLVLFEYGLLRNVTQFRYQAYVALVVAFARIFFSNLTAGESGEFWGPRFYTVLPLVLIFFFVYAQLPSKEQNIARDRRLHFDALLAYLGTATVVALLYFQFQPDPQSEWIVTSYAAVTFLLFGAALLLDRRIFLHQGILLSLGTFARGMAHNLFGAGYFGEGDWKGRYFVVGSAVAILLASLFFAFRLRDRYKAPPTASRLARVASAFVSHPEQLQFFVPILLLTTMLALKMREGMVTVSWGLEGLFIILLALAVKERSFRLTGLGLLLLCVVKVGAMDVWRFEQRDRFITLIILGVALIVVGFLYTKYRETIRQYL